MEGGPDKKATSFPPEMITQYQRNLIVEWWYQRGGSPFPTIVEKKRGCPRGWPQPKIEEMMAFAKLSSAKCFNCGLIRECQAHHVVPRAVGGVATVSLCLACHAKVHNREEMTSSALTRFGMRRAKALGARFGRETVVTKEQKEAASRILAESPSTSVTRLSKQLGLSLGTASRLKQKLAPTP